MYQTIVVYSADTITGITVSSFAMSTLGKVVFLLIMIVTSSTTVGGRGGGRGGGRASGIRGGGGRPTVIYHSAHHSSSSHSRVSAYSLTPLVLGYTTLHYLLLNAP